MINTLLASLSVFPEPCDHGLSSDLAFPLDLGVRPLCRRLRGRGCANCQSLPQAELFVRQRERPGLPSQAPGKSGLHARGEGERVLALESSPSQGRWDPDSLRPALSLGGQASAWEGSPGRSLCLTKCSACGRLWQFAHPRPLSLLQRGLAPRSKGKVES